MPRPIHGAGCARPRLLRLEPSGPLLMSGGRLCVENTTGIFLWVNSNAMAALAGGGDGSECTHHHHRTRSQGCARYSLTDRLAADGAQGSATRSRTTTTSCGKAPTTCASARRSMTHTPSEASHSALRAPSALHHCFVVFVSARLFYLGS